MTLEQRPSGAASDRQKVNSASSVEKGGISMKVINKTEAPQFQVNWKHLFLVALHVCTLVLSITTHKLSTAEVAPRTLP
jgi:hypothetical protein